MTLRAVENTTLPDQVFAQLLGEIVSGRYGEGSILPSERALTAVFSCNRHVVREALKRLEQIGLVKIVQGGSTRVLDYRRTAGLDLLAVVAEHGEALEAVAPLLGDGLQMRAGIGKDVARRCAERAHQREREELTATAEQLAAIRRGHELLAVDRRFWQQILDCAGNLAYQLAFNSLIRAVDAIPQFSVGWLEYELERCDYRRPVAVAIAAGDPDAAEAAAAEALAVPSDLPATLAGARPSGRASA